VPSEALDRERDILVEQARASGKPDSVVEKMVAGRINKYYSEVCLLDQTYLIEDNAGSVSKVLKAASADLGADVSLCGLLRFHVGETGATPTDE